MVRELLRIAGSTYKPSVPRSSSADRVFLSKSLIPQELRAALRSVSAPILIGANLKVGQKEDTPPTGEKKKRVDRPVRAKSEINSPEGQGAKDSW